MQPVKTSHISILLKLIFCRTGGRQTTLQTTDCPFREVPLGNININQQTWRQSSFSRPEIHLAHNPLDTLQEEDVYPDQAFDILNQSTSSAKILPISDNSESSGRGSSSSGSARERLWTAPTSSPSSCNGGINSKKSFQNISARESPDEGIQTDSGTDVQMVKSVSPLPTLTVINVYSHL